MQLKVVNMTFFFRAPDYKQDSYVLYTVNAVFSAALGVHHALQTLCGAGYVGTCEQFLSSRNRRQLILEVNNLFQSAELGENKRSVDLYFQYLNCM